MKKWAAVPCPPLDKKPTKFQHCNPWIGKKNQQLGIPLQNKEQGVSTYVQGKKNMALLLTGLGEQGICTPVCWFYTCM